MVAPVLLFGTIIEYLLVNICAISAVYHQVQFSRVGVMEPPGKRVQDTRDRTSLCMMITIVAQLLASNATRSEPAVTRTSFACHTSPTQGMSLPSGAPSPSLGGPSLLGGGRHGTSVCLQLIVQNCLRKQQNSPSRSGDPPWQGPAKVTTISRRWAPDRPFGNRPADTARVESPNNLLVVRSPAVGRTLAFPCKTT